MILKLNPTIYCVHNLGAGVTVQTGAFEATGPAQQGGPVLTSRAGEEITAKQTEAAETTSSSQVYHHI